jgi:opacity protein-like surface antigen
MTLGTNPKVWSILTVVALATVFCGVSLAQDDLDPSGIWEAQVPGPGGEMTLTLTLENTDGQWAGQLANPMTGANPIKNIRISGNRVQFEFVSKRDGATISFSGTVNAENRVMDGGITAPGGSGANEARFIRRVDSVETEDGGKKYQVGSGPAGIWIGRVRSPDGEENQVTLTLDDENGDWIATLEDPFVDTIRGQDVKVTDTMISFTFRPQGADYPSHFTGTYIAADDRVSGSFSQRGASRFVKFRRDPSTVILGLTAEGEIIEPARVRHQHRFGLTGRFSYWAAMHMVKDETYNMNAITTSQLSYDGAFRWHAMDAFGMYVRLYHGGQGFTDNADKLERFEEIGLTSESNLKLDGWEFGLTGYFGNVFNEDSSFNPYMTAAIGKVSWEVTTAGRGTDIIEIDEDPLIGKDLSFGFGLGTEYELSPSVNLEFEWMWRYFQTQDETIWINTDEDWSNTNVWALSAGLTYMFF